jgi:hypothetical protein
MKQLISGSIITLLLLAARSGQGGDQHPPLQAPPFSSGFAQCRSQVLPSRGEQSYRKIQWRASVLRGIVDAQRNDRPIMLVLMNGHPLGCT